MGCKKTLKQISLREKSIVVFGVLRWFGENDTAQFTPTNRPIFKIFMKFLIHTLGYILAYAKAVYSVRP